MSEKYENEILRQQRKARQEYLNLKKMQSGEMAPPPPESANAVLPKTFNEKTKNFWFYYRWHIIITALLTVAFAVFIIQCANKPDYDLIITVYTSTPVSDSSCNKIQEYFENLCSDINGDGKALIGVMNCSYSAESQTQSSVIASTKLQAEISAEPKAMLYITDTDTYEILNNIPSDGSFFQEECVLLPQDFYEFCKDEIFKNLPEGLFIGRRVLIDSTLQNNKIAVKCHKEAGEILEKLVCDNQ